jgi:hypothetical protein
MLIRLSAVTISLAVALPALAQDAGSFIAAMPPGTTRLSDMIGTDVIGSDINRLGEVKDVLVDRNGMAVAVVIGTGGVLGVGEKEVAVPYGALLWNYEVRPIDLPSSANTGGQPAADNTTQAKSAVSTDPGPAAPPEVTGTVGDPARPAEGLRTPGATVSVTGDGKPVHAVLRGVTREEIRNAPAFDR